MHYYEKLDDGSVSARHFVPMSSRPDALRPTRITDVRKWWKAGKLVVPSVTTVLNVLAKPALTNWLIDQHLQVAAKHPMSDDAEAWVRSVKQATEQEMSKAPDAGTDMHKVLQKAMQGERPTDPHLYEICTAVEDRLRPLDTGWDCESYFVHGGFGGCADLTGDGWVIDYKTKQTADKFKPGRMAYDEHAMQLAAYRVGFGMPQARAANIFICLETGEIDFHEHTEKDLDRGWQMFELCLRLWQVKNGYPEAA